MWLTDSRELSPKQSINILVGNKCDLTSKRQVTTEEAEDFASRNGMLFIETSALSGYNVEKLFEIAASEILDKIEAKEYDINDEV
jgi:GTPase SAR1 family protein